MALPHLIKYVYTHGTDEVIRRGKKIHAIGFVELVEYDDLFGSAVFRVKDDSYSTFYKVYIQKFKDPKDISLRCSCPYNIGDICRHETASLFQLQEMIDKGHLQTGDVQYDQRHTVAKMKTIDLKTLRFLSSPATFEEAEKYLRTQRANIEMAENEAVKASVVLDGKSYQAQMNVLNEISEHINKVQLLVEDMTEARKAANALTGSKEKAIAYCEKVKPFYDSIRYSVDKLELLVDDSLWELPKYRELLFLR